jgi:tetratricopeptide (TPR) repeat protein
VKRNVTLASLLLLFNTFGLVTSSCASPRSLSKAELLALVAGEIIPENVVFDMRSRGLSFVPDAAYKALLKSAGADPRVLAALDTAKAPGSEASSSDNVRLLQHLSQAGALLKSGQLDEASNELTDAMGTTSAKSEIGFVMGMVLISQQRYPEAGQVYAQILQDDSQFPEVHARLSFTYFETGDSDEAIRQARAALNENPNNAVAHMNQGLALRNLQHFDAAKVELQKAVQCKPDYELAYVNLASLLDDLKDFDTAITYFKKALALNPDDVRARYDLGVTYGDKGDLVSAIREYREVKRRDPQMLQARQNLGSALIHTDPGAAINEFRELQAIAPDWPLCHQCLGSALLHTGRLPEAEKEYQLAIAQDPASVDPLNGLGIVYETQKKIDEALAQYRKAEKLDESNPDAHSNIGRILNLQKNYPAAIAELKQAKELNPTAWYNDDLLGNALESSGNPQAAIAEYQQAVTLAPKEMQARLDLANAQEKAGDWVSALKNYHRAAIDEPPPVTDGAPHLRYDAQGKYESAQQRFRQHLADLRTRGKSTEADALEARVKESGAAPNLGDKFHGALQASKQAVQEKRFDDAESSAKDAVAIAEKIQPMDGRLLEAVGQLGNVYAFRLQYKDAETAYNRQLALGQQLYGQQSGNLAPILTSLALLALAQKDLDTAEKYFNRTLDLDEKTYGDKSMEAATAVGGLSRVYFLRQDFPKAESAMQRRVKIFESLFGETDYRVAIPLNSLCAFYDNRSESEKGAACHARMVSLEEKQFGPESPYLVGDLNAEAAALRKLGRTDEAVRLEKRTQTLQSAQATPN